MANIIQCSSLEKTLISKLKQNINKPSEGTCWNYKSYLTRREVKTLVENNWKNYELEFEQEMIKETSSINMENNKSSNN